MTIVATLETLLTANISDFMVGVQKADQQLEKTERGFAQRLDNMGSSLQDAGKQATLFTAPLAAGLGLAINGALNFDRSMTNVGAVLGKDRAQMQVLGDQILALGAASTAGPQGAIDAFYDIAGGVADASTHMAILEAAISTSTAGAASLDGTTAGLISTMNSYGFTADQAGYASDVMTQIVAKGVGTMDEMAAAMPQVTGLAASLGIGFADLGAETAYLTTKGFTFAQAATQQRAMMVALLNPNAMMKQSLHELGYESGTAAIEQLGLVGAFQQLGSESTTFTTNMAGAVGSVEALNGVIALSTPEALAALAQFNVGLEGATARAMAIQLESPASQFDKLKSRIAGVAIEIGETLLPVMADIVTQATPVVAAIADWIKVNPDLAGTLIQVAGGAVLAGPTLWIVGSALKVISMAIPLVSSPLLWLAVGLGAVMIAGGTFDEWLAGVKANAGEVADGLGKIRDALKDWQLGGNRAGALKEMAVGLDEIKTALIDFPLDTGFEGAKALANIAGVKNPSLEKSTTFTGFMWNWAGDMLAAQDVILANFRIFSLNLEQTAISLGPDMLEALTSWLPAAETLFANTPWAGVLGAITNGFGAIQAGVGDAANDAIMKLEISKVNVGKGQMIQGLIEDALSGQTIDLKLLGMLVSVDPLGVASMSGPRLRADVMAGLDLAVESGDAALFKVLVPLGVSFGIDTDKMMNDFKMQMSGIGVFGKTMPNNPMINAGAVLSPRPDPLALAMYGAAGSAFMPGEPVLDPLMKNNFIGPPLALALEIDPAATAAASGPGIMSGLQEALNLALGGGGAGMLAPGAGLGAQAGGTFEALMAVAATVWTDIAAITAQMQVHLEDAVAKSMAINMIADVTVYPGKIVVDKLFAGVISAISNFSSGQAGSGMLAPAGIPVGANGFYTGGYEGLAYVHPNELLLNESQQRAAFGGRAGGSSVINVYGESPYELARMVERAQRERGV